MYKRTILDDLRHWSQKDCRKPLVLRGARQVGKTTVVKMFGDEFDRFLFKLIRITTSCLLAHVVSLLAVVVYHA